MKRTSTTDGRSWIGTLAAAVLVLGGLASACDESKGGEAGAAKSASADEKKLPYIDIAIKLAVDFPEGWGANKQNCLLTDPSSSTGVSDFKGCMTWVIGKKDDQGNVGLLDQRVTVFAVEKAKVSDFDTKKASDCIKSSLTAGDYQIYTKASKTDDPDTQKVISSLKHQP